MGNKCTTSHAVDEDVFPKDKRPGKRLSFRSSKQSIDGDGERNDGDNGDKAPRKRKKDKKKGSLGNSKASLQSEDSLDIDKENAEVPTRSMSAPTLPQALEQIIDQSSQDDGKKRRKKQKRDKNKTQSEAYLDTGSTENIVDEDVKRVQSVPPYWAVPYQETTPSGLPEETPNNGQEVPPLPSEPKQKKKDKKKKREKTTKPQSQPPPPPPTATENIEDRQFTDNVTSNVPLSPPNIEESLWIDAMHDSVENLDNSFSAAVEHSPNRSHTGSMVDHSVDMVTVDKRHPLQTDKEYHVPGVHKIEQGPTIAPPTPKSSENRVHDMKLSLNARDEFEQNEAHAILESPQLSPRTSKLPNTDILKKHIETAIDDGVYETEVRKSMDENTIPHSVRQVDKSPLINVPNISSDISNFEMDTRPDGDVQSNTHTPGPIMDTTVSESMVSGQSDPLYDTPKPLHRIMAIHRDNDHASSMETDIDQIEDIISEPYYQNITYKHSVPSKTYTNIDTPPVVQHTPVPEIVSPTVLATAVVGPSLNETKPQLPDKRDKYETEKAVETVEQVYQNIPHVLGMYSKRKIRYRDGVTSTAVEEISNTLEQDIVGDGYDSDEGTESFISAFTTLSSEQKSAQMDDSKSISSDDTLNASFHDADSMRTISSGASIEELIIDVETNSTLQPADKSVLVSDSQNKNGAMSVHSDQTLQVTNVDLPATTKETIGEVSEVPFEQVKYAGKLPDSIHSSGKPSELIPLKTPETTDKRNILQLQASVDSEVLVMPAVVSSKLETSIDDIPIQYNNIHGTGEYRIIEKQFDNVPAQSNVKVETNTDGIANLKKETNIDDVDVKQETDFDDIFNANKETNIDDVIMKKETHIDDIVAANIETNIDENITQPTDTVRNTNFADINISYGEVPYIAKTESYATYTDSPIQKEQLYNISYETDLDAVILQDIQDKGKQTVNMNRGIDTSSSDIPPILPPKRSINASVPHHSMNAASVESVPNPTIELGRGKIIADAELTTATEVIITDHIVRAPVILQDELTNEQDNLSPIEINKYFSDGGSYTQEGTQFNTVPVTGREPFPPTEGALLQTEVSDTRRMTETDVDIILSPDRAGSDTMPSVTEPLNGQTLLPIQQSKGILPLAKDVRLPTSSNVDKIHPKTHQEEPVAIDMVMVLPEETTTDSITGSIDELNNGKSKEKRKFKLFGKKKDSDNNDKNKKEQKQKKSEKSKVSSKDKKKNTKKEKQAVSDKSNVAFDRSEDIEASQTDASSLVSSVPSVIAVETKLRSVSTSGADLTDDSTASPNQKEKKKSRFKWRTKKGEKNRTGTKGQKLNSVSKSSESLDTIEQHDNAVIKPEDIRSEPTVTVDVIGGQPIVIPVMTRNDKGLVRGQLPPPPNVPNITDIRDRESHREGITEIVTSSKTIQQVRHDLTEPSSIDMGAVSKATAGVLYDNSSKYPVSNKTGLNIKTAKQTSVDDVIQNTTDQNGYTREIVTEHTVTTSIPSVVVEDKQQYHSAGHTGTNIPASEQLMLQTKHIKSKITDVYPQAYSSEQTISDIDIPDNSKFLSTGNELKEDVTVTERVIEEYAIIIPSALCEVLPETKSAYPSDHMNSNYHDRQSDLKNVSVNGLTPEQHSHDGLNKNNTELILATAHLPNTKYEGSFSSTIETTFISGEQRSEPTMTDAGHAYQRSTEGYPVITKDPHESVIHEYDPSTGVIITEQLKDIQSEAVTSPGHATKHIYDFDIPIPTKRSTLSTAEGSVVETEPTTDRIDMHIVRGDKQTSHGPSSTEDKLGIEHTLYLATDANTLAKIGDTQTQFKERKSGIVMIKPSDGVIDGIKENLKQDKKQSQVQSDLYDNTTTPKLTVTETYIISSPESLSSIIPNQINNENLTQHDTQLFQKSSETMNKTKPDKYTGNVNVKPHQILPIEPNTTATVSTSVDIVNTRIETKTVREIETLTDTNLPSCQIQTQTFAAVPVSVPKLPPKDRRQSEAMTQTKIFEIVPDVMNGSILPTKYPDNNLLLSEYAKLDNMSGSDAESVTQGRGSSFSDSYYTRHSTTLTSRRTSRASMALTSDDDYDYFKEPSRVSVGEEKLRDKMLKNKQGLLELDASFEHFTELPESVTKLNEIQSLRLDNNWIRCLPDDMDSFSALEYMSCRDSNLLLLPDNITKCKWLKYLDLDNNLLTKLPRALTQLKQIRCLSVRSNRLCPWPRVINELTNLQGLDLSGNTALIHINKNNLSWCRDLRWLYLEHTSLDEIPVDLNKCTELRLLSFGANFIRKVPSTLGELKKLELLCLSNNKLTTFPDVVCQLEFLKSLSLSGNSICTIPQDIANLTHLQKLQLENVGLKELPVAITRLLSLEMLDIGKNHISDLPQEIVLLFRMRELNIQHNQFDQLPEWLFTLSDLETLNVQHNAITTLPTSVQKLVKLKDMDISGNRLSSLPDVMNNMQLQKLDIHGNSFQVFPAAVASLSNIRHLNASHNKISVIPREIMTMTSLEHLDLSSNFLESITPSIASLTSLKYLNISNCKFIQLGRGFAQGVPSLVELNLQNNYIRQFPRAICKCPNLEILKLDGNKVSSIPSDIARLDHLLIMTMSHNRLLTLPDDICYLPELHTLNIRHNYVRELPLYTDQLHNIDPNKYKWIAGSAGLILDEEQMIRPPPEVIRTGKDTIFRYFKELRVSNATTTHRRKIVLLGQTKAGKSSFANALLTGTSRLTAPEERTRVMDQHLWSPAEDMKCQINDFGGHDIYTITHHFFLTQEAIFLVVVDISIYTSPDHHKLVQYWIDLLTAHVQKAVVRIVATHSDLCSDDEIQGKCRDILEQTHQNEEKLEKYLKSQISLLNMALAGKSMPNLPYAGMPSEILEERKSHFEALLNIRPYLPNRIDVVSSAEGLAGVDLFVENLLDQSRDLNLFRERVLPMSWVTLEEAILRKRRTTAVYLTWSEVEDMASVEANLDENQIQGAVAFLTEVGEVLWYKDEQQLRKIIFHRPSKLVEIMKGIFKHDIEEFLVQEKVRFTKLLGSEKAADNMYQLMQDGIFPLEYFRHFWDYIDESTFQVFFSLMQAFNLCYINEHRSRGHVSTTICFPCYLPENPPVDLSGIWPVVPVNEFHLEARLYFYPHLPTSFIEEATVRLQAVCETKYNWRNGFYATSGSCRVLLRKVDDKMISWGVRGEELHALWSTFLVTSKCMEKHMSYWPGAIYEIYSVCGHCVVSGAEKPYMFPGEILRYADRDDSEKTTCPKADPNDKTIPHMIWPPGDVVRQVESRMTSKVDYHRRKSVALGASLDSLDAIGTDEDILSNDVLQYLGTQLGPEWKSVALLLDFSPTEVKRFEHTNPFNRDTQVFNMLRAWRDAWKDERADYEVLQQKLDALDKALIMVGRVDLADFSEGVDFDFDEDDADIVF